MQNSSSNSLSDSMFLKIQNYEKWNDPSFGFKENWKEELEIIREAHKRSIHVAFNYKVHAHPYYR